MPLLVLGILTFFRDQLVPNDTLAALFAPCLAWTLVFIATAIFIPLQIWRQKLEKSSNFRLLERSDAKIAICFILAHICSASSNGAGVSWSYVPTFTNSNNLLDFAPRGCDDN
jgi:hypothetical protein